MITYVCKIHVYIHGPLTICKIILGTCTEVDYHILNNMRVVVSYPAEDDVLWLVPTFDFDGVFAVSKTLSRVFLWFYDNPILMLIFYVVEKAFFMWKIQ